MTITENNWKFSGKWIKGKSYDYGREDALYYQENHNIILEKQFVVDGSKDIYLYVGVLGYYIASINGIRVGDAELNSDWTNYAKCVYYDTYNITKLLKKGTNTIAFELGNGMYNPSPLKMLGKYSLRSKFSETGEIGDPRLICDIVEGETILVSSDAEWTYHYGQNLFNNMYLGETVDNTYVCEKKFQVEIDTKERKLVPSYIPKITQHHKGNPIDIKETAIGVIFDFGEIISGFIDITWQGIEKQKIVLQYSEEMTGETLNYATSLVGSVGQKIGTHVINGGLGGPEMAIQTDTIISTGGKNHFGNKFSYHSFRYVLVTGIDKKDIINIHATYVYTDLKTVGQIKTDNTFFNTLYEAGTKTKLNNVHSTFEDCPRERLGYGGDIVALATSNLYMFDTEEMYKKIVDDFLFEQTAQGGIPETAPYIGIQTMGTGEGEGPLLWQLVLPYILHKHLQFYGDISYVKKKFRYAKKQIDYLLTFDVSELSQHCIGDHGSILINGDFRTPTPDKSFIGFCTILLFLKHTLILGEALGYNMAKYSRKYEEVKNMILEDFLNDDGSFGEGTQSGFAFALALELTEGKELCQKFVNKIELDKGIFNSGIFGMMFTYEMLSKYGHDTTIEKWLLRKEAPSYAQMLKRGNKVLSELFVGQQQSMNHAMFTSYQQWYYQGLAGIKVAESAIGFNECELSPYFSEQVNAVSCELKTKQGIIKSSWIRTENEIEWKIMLPDSLRTTKIIIPKDYRIIDKSETENQMTIRLECVQ